MEAVPLVNGRRGDERANTARAIPVHKTKGKRIVLLAMLMTHTAMILPATMPILSNLRFTTAEASE